MAEYIKKLTMRKCCIDEDGQTDEPIIKKLNEVIDFINSIDVAPVRHGRWVASGQCNHKPYRMRSADHWTTYKCSECGFSNGRRYNDNFCPNCGAKMDLEDNHDSN